jgi:predicted MPP superfamily phosphohydrolase
LPIRLGGPSLDAKTPPPPSRRRFLKRTLAATLLTGVGAIGYAWGVEPHWVEVVRRDLPVAGLPAALEGRSLVQLSDLHVGPEVDDAYLVHWFDRVRQLAPDLIVFTGDYMTCKRDEQLGHAADVLRHLPRGRLGTVAVLGNHDYGMGYANQPVADRMARILSDNGVRVLRNECVEIEGLGIIGIEDLWCPLFREHWKVWPDLGAGGPAVVLCHNPDTADKPIWSGYRGWLLAGHTHGGQCRLPLFGAPAVPVDNKNYVAGEYDVGAGRRLYINRGLGHLLRLRFNARPEVTVFTLRRAAPPHPTLSPFEGERVG